MCTWFNKKELFANVLQFPNVFIFEAKNCGDTTRFFISFASSFNIILLQRTNELINQIYFTSTQ